ncbi:MAG TPA: hypothetical protein VGZ89_09730 [Xanthobacteraceae bacterium]|jgi:hypothetical protein|nr:hypothetical protein [Xanthobacteraceae bacterium]
MTRYLNDDTDFETINNKNVLKDGRRYRAKMVMMDAAPDNPRRSRIVDAQGKDGLALNKPGYRVLQDTMNVSERQKAYDAYDHDLRTAYRRGAGKEDVVLDAPRASGNDAMPVRDIETAYRLYSEEISEAWKTPR